MKKSQLQEKVQKHVDELFLKLSQSLAIDISEEVKQRFYQSLYREAAVSLQKQFRETVIKETEMMFSGLEADLNLTFTSSKKSELVADLILTGFDFGPDVSGEDIVSNGNTIFQEKLISEGNPPTDDTGRISDQEVETVTALEKKQKSICAKADVIKPWTEECSDSDIVKRVNHILIETFGCVKPFVLTRDTLLQDDLGADSLEAEELVLKFEGEFGIKISDDFVKSVQNVGDVYDAICYLLKK